MEGRLANNKHRLGEVSGATGTKRSWDLVGTPNPTVLVLLVIHMSVSALPAPSSQSLGNDTTIKQTNKQPTFYISFLVSDYCLGIDC